MKNLIQLIILGLSLTFVLFTGWANAHPEHDKPQTIFEEQARTTATYHVKRLIEKGQLDKSWEAVKATNAVLERIDSRLRWIVSFANPNPGKDEKTLFIFLTNTGYYLSTNFTGK